LGTRRRSADAEDAALLARKCASSAEERRDGFALSWESWTGVSDQAKQSRLSIVQSLSSSRLPVSQDETAFTPSAPRLLLHFARE